ncbi:rRNA methyltransferase 3, mitochondrial [Frankliniella fusca]|uniref:rRNA methyltransferase 3, mitochondrial n=1 Tax=Frankliniella fusca TaxID=407009 RepID=A0AAE1HWS7_9NEOP|nr:rRNA methyltransferase 3, mitochondrial [Frankliniella fusca]
MYCWSSTMRLGARCLLRDARKYSRKVSRIPVKVLSPDDSSDQRTNWRPVIEESMKVSPQNPSADEEPAMLEGKPSRLPPGFPPYENKGHDDRSLSQFALATSDSKSRLKSGLIRLEGKRLIQEGLDSNLTPKALFFSRVQDVTSLRFPPKKFQFEKLTYEKLKRWSKLITPPGVIGFFKKPDTSSHTSAFAFPFSIICDNVRDPQNLGSILRVAASAGCRSIYLTKGCVDLWNEKVLRSAMGSHFHLNISDNMDWDQLEAVLEPPAFVIFADNKDSEQKVSGEIVRDDVFYEATKPYRQDEESNEHESSHLLSVETSETSLPVHSYYLVNYPAMDNIFLVLGGETGFSNEALKLGESLNRFRVNIPMLNNVESLNVTSALSILTFEMKRQFEISREINEINSVTIPAT